MATCRSSVLKGVDSRIYPKQLVVNLPRSHVAFSLTASLNSHFALSGRLDFYMVDKLLIAVYAFPMHILTLLSVDEISLPRYVNWSKFKGLSFYSEMASSCLKHMNLLYLSLRKGQWFCRSVLWEALDYLFAQLAGAVDYTGCFFGEGKTPSQRLTCIIH